MSHMSIFQRFCVMMLLLNGGVERSVKETNDFLQKLNVYSEIRNIKQTVRRESKNLAIDRLIML